MKSIYHARAIAAEPVIPTSETREGYPTNGSSAGGQLSTVIGAYWYHMVTMEVVNAIKGAGLTPDAADLGQLDKAISARLAALQSTITGQMDELANTIASQGIPTGALQAFDLDSAPNQYWLVCNGQAVSRATYATLFSKIGTRHGAGNGSTTFNLPDYRNRVFWGADSGIGQIVEAGLPNVYGEIGADDRAAGHATGAFYAARIYDKNTSAEGGDSAWYKFVMNASRCSPVYGRSDTVTPPSIKALICIHI